MNAEEMRIKVAEAMGWKWIKPLSTHDDWWFASPSEAAKYKSSFVKDHHDLGCYALQVIGGIKSVPDFPASLDACAEFERTLTDVEIDKYIETLHEIIPASPLRSFWSRMVRALAPQRCEAFLRVKGLWTPPAPQEAEKNLP